MTLKDRHIVVTGGDGALGQAVVERLLAEEAVLHLPLLRAAAGRVPNHARVHVTEHVDLASESAVTAFFASAPPLWGSVHLAGGFAAGPLLDTSLSTFRSQWELNAVTAFLCCREAARRIRSTGQGGRLVNVAARTAVQPGGGVVAYAAAKAAVAALTQSVADELKEDRILCNAVLPSIMDTPAGRAAMPQADHSRWPKTAEVAGAIAFLVSPANALTSGALMPVYGRA